MSIKFRPTLSLEEISKIKDWAVEDIQACLASGYDFSLSAGIVQRMNGILEKYGDSPKVARSASQSASPSPLLTQKATDIALPSPSQEAPAQTPEEHLPIYEQINTNWENYPDHKLVTLYNMLAPELHSYLDENARAKCFYLACIDAEVEPNQEEDLASFNLYCKGMMLVR